MLRGQLTCCTAAVQGHVGFPLTFIKLPPEIKKLPVYIAADCYWSRDIDDC